MDSRRFSRRQFLAVSGGLGVAAWPSACCPFSATALISEADAAEVFSDPQRQ
jgi:peptide-methionine (R)-S-oxide reductase